MPGMFDWLFSRKDLFSYPLSIADAASGELLKKYIPEERQYMTGPFYCDRSPDSHYGQFQHAIDFIVKDGSLVYAGKSGTVVDVVEHNTVYGETPEFADTLNYVTIQHDDCLSQYAHLEKNSPSAYGIYKGKHVMRGQVIGVVGKTGWVDAGTNGDHLHFMVFLETKDGFESIPAQFKS